MLVCLVVLVHVGVPMFFYTCGVFMNTESGVEREGSRERARGESERERNRERKMRGCEMSEREGER